MSDSVFLSWVRGNRLSAFLNLAMDNGGTPRYSSDYSYIEIPVREFYNPSTEEILTKAQRNQHLRVIPACKMELKGKYRVLVKTNPKLQEVSTCPTLFILDINEQEQCSFYATFRKDFDITELDWAVRLYLLV